jgi:hypothetical protein
MLMVPWAVVGATRTLAQSALPDTPQVYQRPAAANFLRIAPERKDQEGI